MKWRSALNQHVVLTIGNRTGFKTDGLVRRRRTISGNTRPNSDWRRKDPRPRGNLSLRAAVNVIWLLRVPHSPSQASTRSQSLTPPCPHPRRLFPTHLARRMSLAKAMSLTSSPRSRFPQGRKSAWLVLPNSADSCSRLSRTRMIIVPCPIGWMSTWPWRTGPCWLSPQRQPSNSSWPDLVASTTPTGTNKMPTHRHSLIIPNQGPLKRTLPPAETDAQLHSLLPVAGATRTRPEPATFLQERATRRFPCAGFLPVRDPVV